MSTEQNTAPVDTTAAQPATTELQPGQGVPADGVVPAEEAQPDAAAQAAAAEAEARKAEDNRNRANRRFSDLTRERNAAIEEAAYWRGVAEAKAGGQQQPQQQPQPQPSPAQAGAAPNPNDTNRYPGGEFDPQYMRDLARFEARQELQAIEAERAKQREFETGRERYHAALDAIDTEEFDGNPTGQAAETIARIARADRTLCDTITAAQNPAWIAEHFARFPSDVSYALSLPPVQRALLIGQLDAKYGAYAAARPRHTPAQQQQAAPAPQASPAPQLTPAPQVNGRGSSPNFNPETASYEEYAKARAEGRFQ